MGLGSMFSRLLRPLLEPAKKPESALSLLEKQLELLKNLDSALLEINKAKEQIQRESGELHNRLPSLVNQAERALSANREDLARTALQRRKSIQHELEALKQQMLEVEQEEENLKLIQHRLAAKLESYKTKRDVATAREKAAEAQARVGEAITGVAEGTAELNQALERAEENRQRMIARAAAIKRLVRSGVVEDPLEITSGDSESTQDVEKELEALKRRFGAKKPPAP